MINEVVEFAEKIGATDLKAKLDYSEYHKLLKRHNYFSWDNDKFLIIKISKIKPNPFWGFGKKYFNGLQSISKGSKGKLFLVVLVSNISGWVLPEKDILSQISDESLSYSESNEYKIHKHNLKDCYRFVKIEDFMSLMSRIDTPK